MIEISNRRTRDELTSTWLPHYPSYQLDALASLGDGKILVPVVRRYIDGFLEGQRQSLVMYGSPGTGKTMTAAVIWKQVAHRVPDRFRSDAVLATGTADNFVWMIGSDIPAMAKQKPADEHKGLPSLTHCRSAYFAILDDIDKCPSVFHPELFGILNARLASLLPTIITMNSTPRQLASTVIGASLVNRFQRHKAIVMRLDGKGGAA